jgi:hypothetical protein
MERDMFGLIKCMFCGSTDGAVNEVCNYCFMCLQHKPEFNDYLEKHEELEKARKKLLETVGVTSND